LVRAHSGADGGLLWSFSEGVRLGAGAELRAAAERARAFLEAGGYAPGAKRPAKSAGR